MIQTLSPVWGDLQPLDTHLYRLSAPRDAADGIGGSALAVGGRVPGDCALSLSWEIKDHWGGGGDESWRGFWVLFPHERYRPWPALYFRPHQSGWEMGVSHGPKPEDQEILSTASLMPNLTRFAPRVGLAAQNDMLHLSIAYLNLGGEGGWLTLSLRRTSLPSCLAWPLTWAAYCEACVVELTLA